MKIFKFKNNRSLTSNLVEFKKKSHYAKVQKGKWYHFERIYVIASDNKRYGFVLLTFFDRMALHFSRFCKSHFFSKVKVILPENLAKVLPKTKRIVKKTLPLPKKQEVKLVTIPIAPVNPLHEITTLMRKAKNEECLEKKKNIFNQVYQLLSNESELGLQKAKVYPLLFSLFEAYANQIFYDQTIDESKKVGFQKCSALMQLSLHLQLQYLGLLPVEPKVEWEKYESIEDFLNEWKSSLTKDKLIEIMGEKEASTHKFSMKDFANLAKEHEIAEIVQDSLINLVFSFQNLSLLQGNGRILFKKILFKFHTNVNALLDEFLKDDPKKWEEYTQNRRSFMEALIQASPAKIRSRMRRDPTNLHMKLNLDLK